MGILIAIGLAVAGLTGVVTTKLGTKMNSLDLAGGGGAPVVTYTITTSVYNGTISPSGVVSVAAGGSVAFTADCPLPEGSWWLFDEGPISFIGTSYTFSNVQSNHSVYLYCDLGQQRARVIRSPA